MKAYLTILIFIFSLSVECQVVHKKTSKPFVVVDDRENYVNFPGGDSALHKYLSDSIIYPISAWKQGIHGTVYIQFSISTSGEISDVRLSKGLTPEIDKIVLRAVSKMPNWQWDIKDIKEKMHENTANRISHE